MSKRKSRRNTRRFRLKKKLRKELTKTLGKSEFNYKRPTNLQELIFHTDNFFRHWQPGEKKMNIPVVHESGTENEFEVELCCVDCAAKSYGWSSAQFCSVHKKAIDGESIQVPDSVNSEQKFIAFVKTL